MPIGYDTDIKGLTNFGIAMNISRRNFLGAASATAAGSFCFSGSGSDCFLPVHAALCCREPWIESSSTSPTFGIIPVVGDGKWISKDPPDESGYYERRAFDVTVGIQAEGRGAGWQLAASTVAPVGFGEQQIEDVTIETEGCAAQLVSLDEGAAQLVMQAPQIAAGDVLTALAKYRVVLSKSYMDHQQEKFPSVQQKEHQPKNVNRFLKNSPGIKANSRLVKDLSKNLITSSMHPWQAAHKFYEWVWENIKGVPGRYTSVDDAIKNLKGDCEERACTFIALCRANGIPARQVWIPSHAWAEFGLHDEAGKFHWIPVHTAAYSWFGWTGVHELVLQKGDRIRIPSRRKTLRLIDDWYRMKGAAAKFTFGLKLTPVASELGEAGPGGRRKMPDGRWELIGDHPANKFHRKD